MDYNSALSKLEKYGQQHILKFYNELSELQKKELLEQIEETDFDVIEASRRETKIATKGVITPLSAMQLDEIEKRRDEFYRIGMDAIKKGQVGAVLLAGGMGTRLGSDNPKGMYNIGINKDVYIFQRIVENLMDIVNKSGVYIHLFVMTSEKNNDITIEFFEKMNYFGYDREYISFFKQEMAPATDYNGKVFMEEKYKIATSPNGNGGWFSSILRSHVIDIINKNNIEWLNVFSVDNVLQRIADPVFVGATIATNSKVGSKVVRKAFRDEKVGVMCLEDGKPSIVEYYELTEKMLDAVNEQGEPAYNYGVILNYLLNVSELMNIAKKQMPLHIVEKKIKYIDENGNEVSPEEPNGYKYETLILDMIHLMDTCLPFEVVRNKEFAPIKNKTGVDSVDTARQLLKENGIEL